MYILLPAGMMRAILDANPWLVEQFVAREPGAVAVLHDALLERASWSGESWVQAKKKRDLKKNKNQNLFWIGFGIIRQNVIRRNLRGRDVRGWKQIDTIRQVRHRHSSRRESAQVTSRPLRYYWTAWRYPTDVEVVEASNGDMVFVGRAETEEDARRLLPYGVGELQRVLDGVVVDYLLFN